MRDVKNMLNKRVKIKKVELVGKIVEIKFVRGIKVLVVELDNGSTWQGPEERLVVCE